MLMWVLSSLLFEKVSYDQIVECRNRARRIRGQMSEGGGHLPHFYGFEGCAVTDEETDDRRKRKGCKEDVRCDTRQ